MANTLNKFYNLLIIILYLWIVFSLNTVRTEVSDQCHDSVALSLEWIAPVPMVCDTDWAPRLVDRSEDSTVCIPNGRGNMTIKHYTDWAISAFIEGAEAFKIFE